MCLYLMRDIVSPLSGFGSPFGQRRRDIPASVIALTSDDGSEVLISDENEALAVTQETIDIVEDLWS